MIPIDVVELTTKNTGVKAGRLVFKSSKVAGLIAETGRDHRMDEELKDLSCRLQKIHRRVNMHVRSNTLFAYDSF
jgi:hypothetical protein